MWRWPVDDVSMGQRKAGGETFEGMQPKREFVSVFVAELRLRCLVGPTLESAFAAAGPGLMWDIKDGT